MLDLGVIFKGIGSASAVIRAAGSLIKGTKGIRRSLLVELQRNIQLIFLYADGGAPIDKVIARLETARCQAALESEFNFNSIKRGKVGHATAGGVPQFKGYVGRTTEQLFTSIHLKIRELQSIVEIDTENAKFRKSVRLFNILKLMLLLLKHIKS